MRIWALILPGLALSPSLAAAEDGSVIGQVQIDGVEGNGKRAPKEDRSDVVVYVPDFDAPAPAEQKVIVQKDRMFVPSVLPVVKGQSVEFSNQDPFYHNVFSNSRAAGSEGFDLGKYKGAGKPVKFEQTGVVEVYCDIHESMVATVLVLPNAAYAVTGPDGRFAIRGVPPGRHKVYAWVRNGKPATAEVEVRPGQPAPASFALEQSQAAPKHKNKRGEDYRSLSSIYSH